jgi:hypothetical protein
MGRLVQGHAWWASAYAVVDGKVKASFSVARSKCGAGTSFCLLLAGHILDAASKAFQ